MSGFVRRNKVVDTTNPAGGINPAKSPNVGQYGWTSFDAGNVNQIIEYVDLCKKYAESANQSAEYIEGKVVELESFMRYIENIYEELKPIYESILPIYDDIIIRHEDIIDRHTDIIAKHKEIKDWHYEVGVLSEETEANAAKALASQLLAGQSEQGAEGWYDKSYELYEELQKGNVYRGTWNPHSGAYPDSGGTNSTWDVILNEGDLEYRWNNILWFWGDRLVYIKVSDTYQQIESGTTVTSVNGKKGAVILSADDVKAVPVTRTVNGKALSANISITAGDTNAVPVTRRINNKVLDSDVVLTHADVNAVPIDGSRAMTNNLQTPSINITTAESAIRDSAGESLVQSSVNFDAVLFGNATKQTYIVYKGFLTARKGVTDYKIYHEGFKPTATDVGALPINGGTLTNQLNLSIRKSAMTVNDQASISFQDRGTAMFHTFAEVNSFKLNHGNNAESAIAEFTSGGNLSTTGPQFATTAQWANAFDRSTAIAIEAPNGAAPYLSFKSPNLANQVIGMTFNGSEIVGAQRFAAGEYRVATNAGLKFSESPTLAGASWGVGMEGPTGVLSIHRYQEGVRQNAPLQFDINNQATFHSNLLIDSGYTKVQRAVNPAIEMEATGKHFAMIWLDTNNGDLHFANSNGAGAAVGRRAKMDGSGNVHAWGSLKTNSVGAGWGRHHNGGLTPRDDSQVGMKAGEWHPLITSNEYAQTGVGYSCRWQLGHFRPGGANNGDVVLNMTGDGLLAGNLRYHFTSTGELKMEGGYAGGWNLSGTGMLGGTVWGGTLDGWIAKYYAPISDATMKRNIKPSTKSALADVSKIDFVSYDWDETNPMTKDKKSPKIGLTAQQMEEIDECYTRDIETFKKDGSVDSSVKSLDVTNMLALALKAIQELQECNQSQQEQINELKEKLNEFILK